MNDTIKSVIQKKIIQNKFIVNSNEAFYQPKITAWINANDIKIAPLVSVLH